MAEPPELYKNGFSNDEFHSLYPLITKDLLGALRQRSISAKTHAYCPYSNFRVGATLVTIQGEYFDGANIENAAYPVGICAERTALGTAIFTLSRKNRGDGSCDDQSYHGEENKNKPEDFNFIALAIATDGENPVSPCGMCRQFIREFCHLNMPILMFNKSGDFMVLCLAEEYIYIYIYQLDQV
ncbi:Cytidine deaminase [Golovinomyces cichoracearum]|uniref:Cytidine deaminase n=1 Tax=Golovinomyces cichoracearum TaxID=62708 RepID=A0A420I421_9PEZI|nr:Cytidine deaminase [Golovinomyces cichoracearum]